MDIIWTTFEKFDGGNEEENHSKLWQMVSSDWAKVLVVNGQFIKEYGGGSYTTQARERAIIDGMFKCENEHEAIIPRYGCYFIVESGTEDFKL